MDLFGFDDDNGQIFLDEAVPRDEITKDPEIVIDRLEEVQEEKGEIDCIVASSGYGMPCKRAVEADVEEINLATFMTQKDLERRLKIVGLRELMKAMKKAKNLNIYFTPGAIHLPTVPERRKANRVDLGTSDKIYTAALTIKDQAERLGIEYSETSVVAVEIGFAYTSAMAIDKGRITDAMAATAGFPGYMGLGFMDSELSYALGNICDDLSKMSIFRGGSAYVAGIDPLEAEIEEFVKSEKEDERVREGYKMMLEAIVKDVVSLLPSVTPREIILSGRFTRIPKFVNDLERKFEEFFEEFGWSADLVNLRHRGEVCKEAAEGAAVLANGLAGGKHKGLVETMRIEESRGSIFDHLYLADKYTKNLDTFEE